MRLHAPDELRGPRLLFAMLKVTHRRPLVAALPRAARAIWGVAPEPVAEPLWMPMDVPSPPPLFDGATATKVTTLENGLKVASSDLSTPATSLGLYVATGSKYETVPGTAHMMQHMAFRRCWRLQALWRKHWTWGSKRKRRPTRRRFCQRCRPFNYARSYRLLRCHQPPICREASCQH